MRVSIDGVERNLPDFLIVGAGKSGTTSLYEYLIKHPEIFLSRKIKEMLFFHVVNNPNKEQLKFMPDSVTNFERYLSIFDEAGPKQICGEVCPSYLYYYKLTIDNLKRFHPGWENVKIVIILREPVSKIISQYYFLKYTLKIPEQCLAKTLAKEKERLLSNNVVPDLFLVDTTRYYLQVKAYLNTFKQVKIFFYDDFERDPQSVIKELLRFLQVQDPDFVPNNIGEKYNVSRKRKIPRNSIYSFIVNYYQRWLGGSLHRSNTLKSILIRIMFREEVTDKDRRYLRSVFEPEVENLRRLLNNDLSFWRNDYKNN